MFAVFSLLTTPSLQGMLVRRAGFHCTAGCFPDCALLPQVPWGWMGPQSPLEGLLCTPPAIKLGRGESIGYKIAVLSWYELGFFIPKNESDVVTESNRKTTEAS